MNHRLAKTVFNLWPPFWGAGIRVSRIAPDWKQVEVRLRLGLANRNYVGVHFGGSLYAMTDPFYMLMTSLKSSAEISAEAGNPWYAHSPTLENYVGLLSSEAFRRYFPADRYTVVTLMPEKGPVNSQ